MKPPQPTSRPPATARLDLVGVLCGTGAALFWAIGFVAARHGISAGFSPVDIVLHRFVWAGLLFLPVVARDGLGNLGGVGLARGVALACRADARGRGHERGIAHRPSDLLARLR